MDGQDVRLLNLLQHDSRVTSEQLGAQLNLSPSAVTRRIQRLWADGSIARAIVVLGERVRGGRVTAIMTVQLDRHQPAEAEAFRRTLRDAPEVQMFAEITGASDVMLVVSVRDMDQFNAFADDLANMRLVRRYETSFVKRMVKFTTAVPLAESEKP